MVVSSFAIETSPTAVVLSAFSGGSYGPVMSSVEALGGRMNGGLI